MVRLQRLIQGVGVVIVVACGVSRVVTATEPDRSKELTSAPLRARSGPRGRTLFTTLSPEQTGIKAFNAYDDPAMWGVLFHEFNSGAIGTGVAIGDFDGDGRPDVYVACKTGSNHLFRNLGDFRFTDVTENAGVGGPPGAWKQGVAFADVNNDGRLDLYVCRFNAPNLLYVNQGDGTFREEAAARGLALVDASNMAAFCDYDRDGWLDVYVQTNVLDAARHPNGQPDHLYHNNGDGTFTEVTRSAGIAGETRGHSATWWDFDEDGWPDLYVANDFAQPDQIYHNNRDGTFTDVLSKVVPHTPHFSMGADLGDLNNDGHLDLLVADMAARTRYMDNRGMATLRSVLPEDLLRPHAAPQYMQSALFLGTGTGRMLEAARLASLHATDWTFCVRLEDLDLDGRVDAYFTNGMAREFNNSDLVQRSMEATSVAERVRVMKDSPVLAQQHLAFRNLGDLQFKEVGAEWGLDHRGVGFGAALGDLDGDGDLDLVYANFEGEPTVCRNDSDTGHAIVIELRGTASNRFGIGTTVRIETVGGSQMRMLTLARGYLSTSEPAVHFGLGDATSLERLTVEWPSGRRSVFTRLPVDRHYTITEAREDAVVPPPEHPEPLFVEVGQVAGLQIANRETPLDELSGQPLLPFRGNRPGPSVACADLDGDGEDDLALSGVSGDPGHLLSNVGGGRFFTYGTSLFTENSAVADGPILAVDVDADGDLDLIVTKAGVAAPADSPIYQPRIWLNNGAGQFDAAPAGIITPLKMSVGTLAAADFEHSGRLGIFIGGRVVPGHYGQTPRSALLSWRDGRYVDVSPEIAPSLVSRGMVTAALWSDVDGDGWTDLIIAYDWGSVRCFRNVKGQRFEDVSDKLGFTAAGTGWWHAIAAADFNSDGRPDYVVGNVGLNTRYHASPSEPALLYVDVPMGNAAQLIEAQVENGTWYPLRPRDVLLRAIPALGRLFPTAESFSRAKLDDVFAPELLAKGMKLAVTELRSGVFLSQPDGSYRFTTLPRLAQIAPIHGLVAGDFDGDGRADILLIGNSYAPVPETGRFDGGIGWLLRGDGHGGFQTVPADESGIVVDGDARALVAFDVNDDGWPDIFATRNNDVALTYLSRFHAPERNSFAVRLRGRPGNPNCVGARLTVQLTDGSVQAAEIAAGSGYLSQSSSTIFFGYRTSAPPERLTIHWPDGGRSERAFTSPPIGKLTIAAP